MGDTRDKTIHSRPDEAGADERFLERWSRRKQADSNSEAVAEPPQASATATFEQPTMPATVREPQQVLTDADMPPIDSLDSDSDFSVFMSPRVSDQLRTQALRKLFHLPAFNVVDGLNDYDEDYTQLADLGGVVTHEMKRLLKRELEAKAMADEEGVPASTADDVAEDSTDMDDDAGESV